MCDEFTEDVGEAEKQDEEREQNVECARGRI